MKSEEIKKQIQDIDCNTPKTVTMEQHFVIQQVRATSCVALQVALLREEGMSVLTYKNGE